MKQTIDEVLSERGARYGTFAGQAEISQHIKRVVRGYLDKRGKSLADDQMEAVEMVIHKLARAINGDADFIDHWVDMAGYAQLVADRLQGVVR